MLPAPRVLRVAAALGGLRRRGVACAWPMARELQAAPCRTGCHRPTSWSPILPFDSPAQHPWPVAPRLRRALRRRNPVRIARSAPVARARIAAPSSRTKAVPGWEAPYRALQRRLQVWVRAWRQGQAPPDARGSGTAPGRRASPSSVWTGPTDPTQSQPGRSPWRPCHHIVRRLSLLGGARLRQTRRDPRIDSKEVLPMGGRCSVMLRKRRR
jgi:hypothetical protein